MRIAVKKSLRAMIHSQKGVAMMEFAIFLPLILILFFSVVELTRYVIIMQRVERTNYALSNIIVQYLPHQDPQVLPASEISKANMRNDVFGNVARAMGEYYTSPEVNVIVTSVIRNPTNPPPAFPRSVLWQMAGGGTLGDGATVSIVNGKKPSQINDSLKDTPADFTDPDIRAQLANMQVGENMIVVEVFYVYRPIFSEALNAFGLNNLSAITLISRSYAMPRNGNLVTLGS